MDLNMDPAHTDSDALRKEVARYRSKITAIVQACEPFARLAKGIPHNWPGRCVLTIDEYPSGTRALNYLKEADNTTEPTIDDWRNLRDTLRWMPDVRPD